MATTPAAASRRFTVAMTVVCTLAIAGIAIGNLTKPQKILAHETVGASQIASTGTSGMTTNKTLESRTLAWSLFDQFLHNGSGNKDWGTWQQWQTRDDLCLDGLSQPCPIHNHSPDYSLQSLAQEDFELPHQGIDGLISISKLRNEKPKDGIPFATVIYNAEAADHVRAAHLNSEQTFAALINSSGNGIPKFKDGSIILKVIWELLYASPGQPSTEAYAHVWDPTHPPDPSPMENKIGDDSTWPTEVVVDEKIKGRCDPGDYELVPSQQTGSGAPSHKKVPLGCFYFVKVTKSNASRIKEEAIPGPYPSPGDYIVLVGLHIIKKVNGNWVWSTVWWTNRPNYSSVTSTNYGAGRPIDQVKRWNHYVVNATNSETDLAGNRVSAFNPYIEGQNANTSATNCISCHSHAVYPNKQSEGVSLGSRDLCGNIPDGYQEQDANTYFQNAATADSLWTLVDKFQPEKSQNPGPITPAVCNAK